MAWNSKELAIRLFDACTTGQESEVQGLLQGGVDPDHWYNLPLHWACANHHPRCAELLIKWGADVRRRREDGGTPLHWACLRNSMKCIKVLLDNHSPTDIKNSEGKTPMDVARERGNNDAADFIIKYKAPARGPLSFYPSIKQLCKIQLTKWYKLGLCLGLMEEEMVMIRNSRYPTAETFLAAKVKNMELKWNDILYALLGIEKYKLADSICRERGEGQTVLSVCTYYCWLDYIKVITDSARFNPKEPVNKAGDSVLSIACVKGHIDVIDYFVKDKGWELDGPVNAVGDTLRTLAESHNLSAIIKYLDNPNASSSDAGQQQKYIRILDSMMSDPQNTIMLHFLKMYFIGSAGIGKSTTRNRLIGWITNLASVPEAERKCRSTHLAECNQVLAVMDKNTAKLTLKASNFGDYDDETRMLFAYVHSRMYTDSTNSDSTLSSPVSDRLSIESSAPLTDIQAPVTATLDVGDRAESIKPVRQSKPMVDEVITRLRSISSLGKYTEQLENKILINLVDVGGQPGFLEMLPFLSKGPGMFLAFFRLDKDLDEPCEVSYERDSNKITPYKAVYTFRETLSQILSAIKHHVTIDTSLDQQLLDQLEDFSSVETVATLVGTFKDQLEAKVQTQALLQELSAKYPDTLQSELEEVIKHVLASSLNPEQNNDHLTTEVDTDIQSTVSELLKLEHFRKNIEDRLDTEIKEKNKAISMITCNYEDLLSYPSDDQQFIALDNFKGTEADIDPLREHLQAIFETYFKDAKLRIHPPQLLLGVVLRKEYDIVSVDDCICIGKALSMTERDVKFSVWYLDQWVGALIYRPEIEDDWFKKNIICSPQVIFDSISSLVVESLLKLHPPIRPKLYRFKSIEVKNWTEKGQFSLSTVKRCHSEEQKVKVEQGKLIPLEKLIKFLEYSNLLAQITTKNSQEIMYFIPAILECASPEELTKSPSDDADTPFPVKISFESGHVPIGVFCAMISHLVSRGSEGLLGMKWELVESGVKRNFVSFRVDDKNYTVTLVAHVDCYEIRVVRQDRSISFCNLCSYVISTVLYVLKEINSLARPIVAFDCQCGQHQSPNSYKLCRLSTGVNTSITCDKGHVALNPSQEYWFAKEVKLGDSVTLKAFPYTDSASISGLTFKWYKSGSYKGDEAELIVKDITKDSCTGYYSCMMRKNKEYFFSMYYCLRENTSGDVDTAISAVTLNADKKDCLSLDKHLRVLRTDMWDIRAEWYDLGVQLDITSSTLEEIDCEQNSVKECFTIMLECWLSGNTPAPTWSALIEALKSDMIERGDIAQIIEARSKGEEPTTLDDGHLNVDKHLKEVINATSKLRAEWRDLGMELGITPTKLREIQNDHRRINGRFTAVLTHWLGQTSPPPTWTALIKALRSPPVGRDDVADKIESTKLAR